MNLMNYIVINWLFKQVFLFNNKLLLFKLHSFIFLKNILNLNPLILMVLIFLVFFLLSFSLSIDHSSTHTISFLLLSILHNLTRCKAFLILNPFKNLPEVDQSIKEQVYYGNYSILDTVDDPYQLFALLKDWLISLDDGLLPYDYLAQALQLIKQDKEAEMYDFLLNLPPVYRDTILYLARFVLAYISFKKSVTYDFTNYSFAKSYTFVFRSTKYSTEPFVNELSRQLIACILRVVSVHARESFLPPDPTINALSEYRVLLFSHIPPSPTAEGGYDYTIENVFTLEKTADMMFSYGILPEKNTFGCSYYRLPNVSETQLSLFYKSTECLIKTAETDIYSLGHLWISPSLSSLLYSLGNKIYYIPWKSIRVRNRGILSFLADLWTTSSCIRFFFTAGYSRSLLNSCL